MKLITRTIFFLLLFAINSNVIFAQTEDLPPNAQPGKCYAKCLKEARWETKTQDVLVQEEKKIIKTLPATFKTVAEQVLIREESKTILPVPAEYETTTEQVLVREESKKLITVPADYDVVTDRILVKEESKKLVPVPATYKTVTDRVKITDESTKWVKKKTAGCLSRNPDDCIIMCLETVPAQYKMVTKTVVDQPATTKEIIIPAEYKTVTKTVVKTPATTKEIVIPAEYKTVTKTVVKTPATTKEIVIPAEYKSVTKTVIDQDARTDEETIPAKYETVSSKVMVEAGGYGDWEEIECGAENNTTTMSKIQQALLDKGYDIGPRGVDGVIGKETRAALLKFQRENNLPLGNLNKKTLRALGVIQ